MVIWLDSVDSTNTYVREHFGELADGALVFAREQTAGRGRRGRSWIAPPDTNLTCTAVLKRMGDGFHAGALLGVAALAMIREAAPGVAAYFKWPNDLYVEDRKLAGILCESARIEEGRVTAVAAGIGINVNLPPEVFAGIDQPATSLLAESGVKYNLDFLAEKLAKQLNRYYIIYLSAPESLLEEWRRFNLLVGETLSVIDGGGVEHTGIFSEILPDGGMVLTEEAGSRIHYCGDVKINRESVNWDNLKHKTGK